VAESAKRRTTDLTAEESGFDTWQEEEIDPGPVYPHPVDTGGCSPMGRKAGM
jgi:hypothetical protein